MNFYLIFGWLFIHGSLVKAGDGGNGIGKSVSEIKKNTIDSMKNVHSNLDLPPYAKRGSIQCVKQCGEIIYYKINASKFGKCEKAKAVFDEIKMFPVKDAKTNELIIAGDDRFIENFMDILDKIRIMIMKSENCGSSLTDERKKAFRHVFNRSVDKLGINLVIHCRIPPEYITISSQKFLSSSAPWKQRVWRKVLGFFSSSSYAPKMTIKCALLKTWFMFDSLGKYCKGNGQQQCINAFELQQTYEKEIPTTLTSRFGTLLISASHVNEFRKSMILLYVKGNKIASQYLTGLRNSRLSIEEVKDIAYIVEFYAYSLLDCRLPWEYMYTDENTALIEQTIYEKMRKGLETIGVNPVISPIEFFKKYRPDSMSCVKITTMTFIEQLITATQNMCPEPYKYLNWIDKNVKTHLPSNNLPITKDSEIDYDENLSNTVIGEKRAIHEFYKCPQLTFLKQMPDVILSVSELIKDFENRISQCGVDVSLMETRNFLTEYYYELDELLELQTPTPAEVKSEPESEVESGSGSGSGSGSDSDVDEHSPNTAANPSASTNQQQDSEHGKSKRSPPNGRANADQPAGSERVKPENGQEPESVATDESP